MKRDGRKTRKTGVRNTPVFAVHLKGFEPPTISFGSCYSIQLSYKCISEYHYTMEKFEMQEQKGKKEALEKCPERGSIKDRSYDIMKDKR